MLTFGVTTKMKTMKKILCLFAFLLASVCLKAQDVISFRDGRLIEAKITEVSDSEIRYLYYDNQSGPTFVSKTTDISKIRFSNGTEREYVVSQPVRKRDIYDGTWKNGFSVAVEFTKDLWVVLGPGNDGYKSFNVGPVVGYRFNKNIFLGGGVKFYYYDTVLFVNGHDWYQNRSSYSIPIFSTFKVNFNRKRVSPYFRLDNGIGMTFYDYSDVTNFGWYANPEFGIDFKLGDNQKSAVSLKMGVIALVGEDEGLGGWHFGVGYRF